MTNIGIEGQHIPSYEMTVIAFERFSQYIPIRIRPLITRNVSYFDIRWCDVYICVRGNNPLSAYLCNIAKKQGCKIILMLDDDLLSHTSSQHPLYDNVSKKSLISIIKLCDVLLTPSRYLANKYHDQFNKDTVVFDTAIDTNDIKNNWYKADKVRLLYASGHMNSFQQLVIPILNNLFSKYKNKISLTIIGGKVNLENIKMQVDYLNSMPYSDYRKFMESHSFDIGLAPLYETQMTKSKYYNKYLEYSSQCICGIYSNTLPYTLIVKDGINGLLTENTPRAWYLSICKLIDNSILRHNCVKNAKNEICREFTPSNIINKICKEIPWIKSYKKQQLNKVFIKLPSFPLFLIQEAIRRILKLLV